MKKETLPQRAIIRPNEIARREKSKNYAKLVLHRLARRGSLRRVAKGAYTSSRDAYSVASNLHYPSCISFLSASYRYGFTETIPTTIFVATPKKHKPVEFAGYLLEFIQTRHMWGYKKEGSETEPIFLADVEKLLIDAFLKPQAMGNFYEIERAFENCGELDIEKLKDYLKRIGSNKIFRQVGYMLEKYKGIDISSLMPIDRNYHALNPFIRSGSKGKINRKWRLIV